VTEFQVGILLADLAFVVVVARVIGRLAHALGQPAVIGEIIGGILVGPTLFHGTVAWTLFPAEVRPYLGALANLGLVLFMFAVGLEFDYSRLRGSVRIAGATIAGATLVPFALGVALAFHLYPGRGRPGLSFMLFTGVAMSVTAFPVLARVLTDRGMHRTGIGTLALSTAAVCDLAAWTTLAFVQAIGGGSHRNHWMVLLVVPFGVLLFTVIRPVLSRALARSEPQQPMTAGNLAVVLASLLASAAVTQLLGLHFVFGAFLFGLAMPRLSGSGIREELVHRTHFVTALLLPVYFIIAGLKVDLSSTGLAGLVDLALILLVAIAGKFGGSWIGARSQGLPARDSAVLATLMNTRGLTELIALGVGLQIGVLDTRLYSLMVVMAVVTTAMTGPLLRLLAGRPDDAAGALGRGTPARAHSG
jgi:K+:H+ antiporter